MKVKDRFVVFEHSTKGEPFVQYHGYVLEVHEPHAFEGVMYDWVMGNENGTQTFDIRKCYVKFFNTHAEYGDYMDKHGIPAINAIALEELIPLEEGR